MPTINLKNRVGATVSGTPGTGAISLGSAVAGQETVIQELPHAFWHGLLDEFVIPHF